MSIPSSPEARQKLVARINEAVEEKLIIDAANAHLSSIRSDVKEDFDIKPKEFNYYVKCFLDENYPEELEAEIDDVISNYRLLKGVSSD